MKYNIVTLDRRYAGYGIWKYYVKTPKTQNYTVNKQLFHEWRAWCWDTWGASKEMSEYNTSDANNMDTVCSNDHWAWQNDHYATYRIYLKDDADVSAFVLRWFY